VRIYENIDPGPYQRMQKKGWLTGQQVGKREAVYEISESGRAIIADLPDSA
jgi:DNA-binding PadR family transcriptional regulator